MGTVVSEPGKNQIYMPGWGGVGWGGVGWGVLHLNCVRAFRAWNAKMVESGCSHKKQQIKESDAKPKEFCLP